VEIEVPEPGGTLNTGPVTVPRLAATVILVRGGSECLQVLLVRRNPSARLMGGVWVFPGGSVDPGDEVLHDESESEDGDRGGAGGGAGDGAGGSAVLRALQTAAARELREEAGIELAPGAELLPFARWITPAELLMRFDAWFFLAAAPDGVEPAVDGSEIVDHAWYAPADALEAATRGELALVFPTIKQLQRLSGFATADALLAATREHEVVAIQPQVVVSDGRPHVVLPDDPVHGR